ncbi:hypothetical protein NDU88_009214 [Pleurodeles waltl]|uniref:Uncharacterized protein n=1 Tax=Pleurodeles waltl TaxID=8319 RepID=A0AAV7RWY3_PLEWA|nr:hypothetical protein NDU88_009214 [Pleurodeles waltl]
MRREGGGRIGPLPPRLPGRWSAALPPHADGGRGDPEEDGSLRNLGLRTTTTTTAERKRSNITRGLNSA